jgi:hypothetical protein
VAWKVHSKVGDRELLPMHRALAMILVSFIGAYVLCCNIEYNSATLISHTENDEVLTPIDIAIDIFDVCNPNIHLYIYMGHVILAEVWAIGYNPAIINDLGVKPDYSNLV